jgi:hypothetical protein
VKNSKFGFVPRWKTKYRSTVVETPQSSLGKKARSPAKSPSCKIRNARPKTQCSPHFLPSIKPQSCSSTSFGRPFQSPSWLQVLHARLLLMSPSHLDDHLGDSLPTKCLASHKTLPFYSCQSVECSSKRKHDRCGD